MIKDNSDWLQEVRELCRSTGIEVYGWGPETVTVKAESPERAAQAASRLRPLGFEPIEYEDDTQAGILLLSRNPSATRTKQRERHDAIDLSRQPAIKRVVPIFGAALALAFIWFSTTQKAPMSWSYAAIGSLLLVLFCREGGSVWGWGLEMSTQELRVRHYFRWTVIPWSQIRVVETKTKYARGTVFVTVTLVLASKSRLRLGTFSGPFASALSGEIEQRRRGQK